MLVAHVETMPPGFRIEIEEEIFGRAFWRGQLTRAEQLGPALRAL